MLDPIEITVTRNIQKARKEAGFTQEQLAEKLEILQHEVARFETTRCPRIRVLAKIAAALDKPICYFFEGE